MTCEVCGCSSNVSELRAPPIGWVRNGILPKTICSDCFQCWYESGNTVSSWLGIKKLVEKQREISVEK